MNRGHLIILRKGRDEWNLWRQSEPGIRPDLSNGDLSFLDLSGYDLRGADLFEGRMVGTLMRGVLLGPCILRGNPKQDSTSEVYTSDLRGAVLRSADLSLSDLTKADFTSADLSLSILSKAQLDHTRLAYCRLVRADLSGIQARSIDCKFASFVKCSINDAYITMADFEGCDFSKSNLRNSQLYECKFRNACLENADLTGASFNESYDYVFDSNRMRGIYLSHNSKDPWSRLRRRYTGHKLNLNLLLLVAFLLQYIVKTMFWYSITEAQLKAVSVIRFDAFGLKDTEKIGADLFEHMGWKCYRVVQLLLAIDKGMIYFLLVIAVILYNVLRAGLTVKISAMFDEEARSGCFPAAANYLKYRKYDKLISILLFAAIGSLIWHASDALMALVWIPPSL